VIQLFVTLTIREFDYTTVPRRYPKKYQYAGRYPGAARGGVGGTQKPADYFASVQDGITALKRHEGNQVAFAF